MKIAIISDTHDNLTNLEKFLEVFGKEFEAPSASHSDNRKVEPRGIICCGDVTTPETLTWLVERFAGPIKLVCGNMEIRQEEFFAVAARSENLEVFPITGEWEIPAPNLKMAFVHKPDKIEELAKTGKYNFVFYGHTHKPWISQSGTVLLANPGTLGGVFTASTFAILDTETGKLELKRLYKV